MAKSAQVVRYCSRVLLQKATVLHKPAKVIVEVKILCYTQSIWLLSQMWVHYYDLMQTGRAPLLSTAAISVIT